MSVLAALTSRAENKCELCGSRDDLGVLEVPPRAPSIDSSVCACAACRAGAAADTLDEKDWFGLKDAAWNVEPAVQVTVVRLLRRLGAVAWAQDLLEQIYMPDEVAAWADAEGAPGALSDDDAPTRDSNGAVLTDGDAVTLIKDLDVKGGGFTAKRGTMVKNIRLIAGDVDNIEGKVNKTVLVLKTKFLKKA